MKKYRVTLVNLALVLCLTACGSKGNNTVDSQDNDSTTTAEVSDSVESTDTEEAEELEEDVEESDTVPPVLSLAGAAELSIELGQQYVDAGASAVDETDGVLAVSTSGEVDSTSVGSNVVTYTATDRAGNSTVVERTVNVVAAGNVEVYAQPGTSTGVLESSKYQVKVMQSGVEHTSYVNRSINNHTRRVGANQPEVLLSDAERETQFRTDSNHWTSFSFEGSVSVEVMLPSRVALSQVSILPSSRNISATIDANVLSFDLDQPGNFYVQVDGEAREPLFIFANSMPAQRPNLLDDNVFTGSQILANPSLLDENRLQTIYFGPGVHTISEPVFNGNGVVLGPESDAARFPSLPSNTMVYIDGGAYIKGLFHVKDRVENVHFVGRGVLSGVDYPHQNATWTTHMFEYEGFGNRSSNIGIEGVTIVDTPKTCVTARNGPIAIDNVKCLSWHANSDAIATGPGSSVTNSFFKVYDDVIKLFHSDITVDNIAIWHQQTGSAFQLSWNLTTDVSNVNVSNIDVIAVDRRQGTVFQTGGAASDFPNGSRSNGPINNALINMRNLDGATLSNIRFDSVRYDAQPFQLMQLQLRDHRPGFTSGNGNLSDLVVRNLQLPMQPMVESYWLDNGVGSIENIEVSNLTIQGTPASHSVVKQTTNAQ